MWSVAEEIVNPLHDEWMDVEKFLDLLVVLNCVEDGVNSGLKQSCLVIPGVGGCLPNLALWMRAAHPGSLPLCPAPSPLWLKAVTLICQFTKLMV